MPSFLKPICHPAEFKYLGGGKNETLGLSRLPSSSSSCHTGFRADVYNSSEAQETVRRVTASQPVLPGRSWDCSSPGGLQIAPSGTSNGKIWSLGNRNLMGVHKRNELAESSNDLLKKKYWLKAEFGIGAFPPTQSKEHKVFEKPRCKLLAQSQILSSTQSHHLQVELAMKMGKVVIVTSSGRVRSSWARVGTLHPDFLPFCPFFLPLCPVVLGFGSPFRVDRESGARTPLLGGILRLASGTRLAGLGMAEGTGSRLAVLAAAPCGRDRR